MSHVRVGGVPTSASPGELRALFEQCGAVRQLVCHFDAGAAEGSALVAFADADAAREAAELLDSYPLGTSLLEVQVVSADQFVGSLLSSLLVSQQSGQQAAAATRPASSSGGGGATAAGPAGVAALQAEMRELQLQLQQQADTIQQVAADAIAQQRQQHRHAPAAHTHSVDQEAEEGWQQTRPSHKGLQAGTQQPQPAVHAQQARQPAGAHAPCLPLEEPSEQIYVGWVGLDVTEEAFRRVFVRWGPVSVERLQPADRLADNGKLYKWGILRYQQLEHAIAARQATARQFLPGISDDMPLKVTFYIPRERRHGQA